MTDIEKLVDIARKMQASEDIPEHVIVSRCQIMADIIVKHSGLLLGLSRDGDCPIRHEDMDSGDRCPECGITKGVKP